MLIMVMTLDLRVMDFTDLGKVSKVCAMLGTKFSRIGLLHSFRKIIVDSNFMDMQIRK